MNKKYVSKILAGILAVNMIVTSSALTFAADNDSKDAYLNYQNETAYMNENYHATGYRELDGEYQIIPDVLNDNYSYIEQRLQRQLHIQAHIKLLIFLM